MKATKSSDDKPPSFLYFLGCPLLLLFGIVAAQQNGAIADEASWGSPSGDYLIEEGQFLLPREIQKFREIRAILTKYTNDLRETDDTPNITASNQKVRIGIVANNCLPFGTLVEIGNRTYEVQDRMNKKYSCQHFDIFTFSKREARKFGRRSQIVKVYK